METRKKTPKPPRAPPADRLQIEGDWTEAARMAMGKKKPAKGWPKPEKKGRGK